jgi:transcriptional regulator with XRE-family HTH domain
MASISPELVVQCRLALQLTQQQFGDMVGCTKRTIQRWEERGALVLVGQAHAIAVALRGSHPELAQQVAASMDMTLDQLAAYQPDSGASPRMDPIESIVYAAAEAMGITPDVARPGVAAAFERARELDVTVYTVANRLAPPDDER